MFKFHPWAFAVLVAVLILASALPALAAGPVTNDVAAGAARVKGQAGAAPITVTHDTVTGTADWTLPAGQCAALGTLAVSGSGERRQQIITKTFADGSQIVLINDLVTGTATDSNNADYRFTYFNNSTETIPAGGGAHSIQMTDTFILSGSGPAKLNVGFNWRWTYTPPASYWPPVDNFVQISTRGEPYTCDPI